MTEAPTVDVLAVLEKAQPSVDDLLHARDAVFQDNDARRKVQTLVASLPSDVRVAGEDKALALRKGLALWVAGREADAEAWLAHSSAKVARTVRGSCLVACGRPAEALKVLEDAGDDVFVRESVAEAHANLGSVEPVRKLAASLAKAGRAASAWYFEGRAAELDGEYASAEEAYRKAIEEDPAHALAIFHLANHLALRGDEDEAVEMYQRCIKLPCPPTNAYLNLGNLYEDRGAHSKAADCYGVVIEADAANTRARLFRGDALASMSMFYDEDLERRADRRSQVLRLPVTDFELSVRSRNCLAKMGVRTLGDLVQRTEQELLSYKNFGETSLQEIKDILAQKGLRLGMGREEVARDEQATKILEGIGSGEAERRKLLSRALSELELSVRSRHCMSVLGLKSVGDLVQRSEAELMTIKNFGQTSLNEVKQKLAELGLALAGQEPTTPAP